MIFDAHDSEHSRSQKGPAKFIEQLTQQHKTDIKAQSTKNKVTKLGTVAGPPAGQLDPPRQALGVCRSSFLPGLTRDARSGIPLPSRGQAVPPTLLYPP